MKGIYFPNWDAVLARTELAERLKRTFRIAIRWYLSFCRRSRAGVNQESARGFIEWARQEAQRLLAVLSGTHQLIGQLLYGTGMRPLECLRLRVKDLDFRGSNGRFEVESVSVGLEGQMTHP